MTFTYSIENGLLYAIFSLVRIHSSLLRAPCWPTDLRARSVQTPFIFIHKYYNFPSVILITFVRLNLSACSIDTFACDVGH